MVVSQAPAGPEAGGRQDQQAVPATQRAFRPSSWVRPAALAVLLLSVVGVVGFALRYQAARETGPAVLTSAPVAAALVLGAVALMALAVLVFRPEQGTVYVLAATSAAWSVALALAMVLAWAAIAITVRQDRWQGTPVTSAAEVDAYLAAHLPAGAATIRLPTGVLIQSVEFLSGDNVQVTGFVWQRYGPDIPEEFPRGIVLPEAVKEAYDAKEAYRYEEDGVETVGWYFAATLRQQFEYAAYPFDEQDVWLRLWPRGASRHVVLVPDFAAYTTMTPSSLPGIETGFVYGGWTPVYSGFSYLEDPIETSFGIGAADQYQRLPELYFNLVLDRHFIGPLFEHVIFFVAVAFLLFGLLVMTTDDENLKSRFQLSTASTLAAGSGLLFAVILKHGQLRGVVGSPGITYIETIPMLLYGLIVLAVLNAIVVASPVNVKPLKHRNNLWPVLAYWPLFIGVLLAATLMVFFRN